MGQNSPASSTSSKGAETQFKRGRWYSIDIPSIPGQIVDVEESIIEALSQTALSGADVFAVRLALDEALANAIKHGNGGDAGKVVSIRFRFEDSTFTVTVKDEGPGFDYCAVPDCTSPDRIELPSGRGLLIMKTYMDKVVFNEKGNEVTMIKGRGN